MPLPCSVVRQVGKEGHAQFAARHCRFGPAVRCRGVDNGVGSNSPGVGRFGKAVFFGDAEGDFL